MPKPVYSTQQDPIGIAGGANVYGFASGDPVNFEDPFGLSDCEKDSQADGEKECQKKNDSQADGHSECDHATGSGCSAEYQRLLASDQPIESAITVGDVVALVGGAKLAFKAKALAGMAAASETGMGVLDAVRASLPGSDPGFVPTGTVRQKIVSSGTYVGLQLLKAKLGIP